MVIVPVSTPNAGPDPARNPPAATPSVVTQTPPVIPAPFRSISTLSLSEGVDSGTFSNMATLSFLQAQVGQASATAILNAIVSYQGTSVYGSGLSPQALSLSDQINNLLQQIEENQRKLRDEIAASDAAAADAWNRGDFWDYISNKVSSLIGNAELLFQQIVGLFLNLAGVFTAFLETCFSRWFGSLTDTQNAPFVGGPRDPQNVYVGQQSLKILLPGLDPVKDIPRQGTASLRQAEKASRLKETGASAPANGAPAGSAQNDDAGSVEETAPDASAIDTLSAAQSEVLEGYVSPDQVIGENEVRQELLQGRRETKADLVAATGLRMAEAEALDQGVARTSLAASTQAAKAGRVPSPGITPPRAGNPPPRPAVPQRPPETVAPTPKVTPKRDAGKTGPESSAELRTLAAHQLERTTLEASLEKSAQNAREQSRTLSESLAEKRQVLELRRDLPPATPPTPQTPPPVEDPTATIPDPSQQTANDFKDQVATAINDARRAYELRTAAANSADRAVRISAAEALRAARMQSPAQARNVGSGVPPEAAVPASRPAVTPLPKAPVIHRQPEQRPAAPAPAPAAGNDSVREAVIQDILRDSLLRTSVNEEIDLRALESASLDNASQSARPGA